MLPGGVCSLGGGAWSRGGGVCSDGGNNMLSETICGIQHLSLVVGSWSRFQVVILESLVTLHLRPIGAMSQLFSPKLL